MQTTEEAHRTDDGIGDVAWWSEKALSCVSCDGAVDKDALDAVEFAHNLAAARRVVASARTAVTARRQHSVLLFGICVPTGDTRREYAWLNFTPPFDSTGWRGHSGSRADAGEWSLPPLREQTLSEDDVVAALVALSAKSRTHPFQVAGTGSKPEDTWLWRVARALVYRSAPWDLSAVDREVGLARALIDRLEAWSSGQTTDPMLSRPAVDILSASDAAAYKAAITAWHAHRLVLNARPNPQPVPHDSLLCGLRVFIAAAERMQATPGFYLHFVAPAIAARLQPGLDALGGARSDCKLDCTSPQ